MDRLAAEGRARRPDLEDDRISSGLLRGERIRVRPFEDWTSSAIDAQDRGNYRQWAREVLVDDDFMTWERINPTVSEIMDFFVSWATQTGEDMGESEAS